MDRSNDYDDTFDYNEVFLAVQNGEFHLAFSLLDRYSLTETILAKSLLHMAIARGLLKKECHPGVLEFCQENNLNDWRIECIRQIDIMRKTKIDIDLNVTFYDVLTRPVEKLAMYANNKNFVKAVDYSQTEFPAYAEFIKANVEIAETKKEFINECVCLMFSVIEQSHKIRIPNADIYHIFQYLSVVDLQRFSAACS
ncbi:uncharacterized protein LOC122505327 [Leptopilina heterotoma]|uniref:uncharacterized protein LOC122505327 n=1 Tax=Leptopilina heterotoma TaxID=63436 RepID=UPI001CA8A375|nr:uncharacterized protein LOC122505327 [Leptopilina heterotoma]XP_043472785.1 uncharacterized protein LOC122505327 [Leptopilina heterotoma]XP_043472793.1 uncharacterized protein LOC122505327 [Leptopilina heterotoma]XP_043472800.1 uncharacterized protein LOC122505327 [Leptopilina heterotoma]